MGNEGCKGRKERDIGEVGPGPGSSQGFCVWNSEVSRAAEDGLGVGVRAEAWGPSKVGARELTMKTQAGLKAKVPQA